jgi:hypothetical protein
MIHLGKILNRPLFQRNFCGQSQNSYRGLVRISPNADNARNFSQCDSLLMVTTVEHILSLTSKAKTNKLNEATKVKLVKTKFSIATNVEFNRRQC